jgi:hypothetical protein
MEDAVRYAGKDSCNFFLARMPIALINISACNLKKRSYAHTQNLTPVRFAYYGF